MHNLKVKNYVLFGRLTKDYSLGYTVSETSEGLLQKCKGGSRYIEGFAERKNTCSQISKDLLLITKIDISS